MPAATEVSGSSPDPQRSLFQAYSFGGPFLVHAPVEINVFGLILRRSLVQACFYGGHTLVPAPAEVAGSYPF